MATAAAAAVRRRSCARTHSPPSSAWCGRGDEAADVAPSGTRRLRQPQPRRGRFFSPPPPPSPSPARATQPPSFPCFLRHRRRRRPALLSLSLPSSTAADAGWAEIVGADSRGRTKWRRRRRRSEESKAELSQHEETPPPSRKEGRKLKSEKGRESSFPASARVRAE
jgi:hypothetical protein